jgi:ankyrin repeat protein
MDRSVVDLAAQLLLEKDNNSWISRNLLSIALNLCFEVLSDYNLHRDFETYSTSFDPSPKVFHGLHIAAFFGLPALYDIIVGQLEDIDVNLELWGKTPLSVSIWRGHDSIALRLLKNDGVNPDFKGGDYDQCPLLFAAELGRDAVIRFLLEVKGIDIELKDIRKRTALACAVWGGHDVVVRTLLDKTADIESPDFRGRTPLILAAEKGDSSMLRLLLEKGADIHSPDHHGTCPLLWAARHEREEAFELLLENGASNDIDSLDSEGRNLLSYAAEGGGEHLIRLLLDKGVDVHSPDNNGRTALSWCRGTSGISPLWIEAQILICQIKTVELCRGPLNMDTKSLFFFI